MKISKTIDSNENEVLMEAEVGMIPVLFKAVPICKLYALVILRLLPEIKLLN